MLIANVTMNGIRKKKVCRSIEATKDDKEFSYIEAMSQGQFMLSVALCVFPQRLMQCPFVSSIIYGI